MLFQQMSAGKFAKLCGVHKKTLFYYDEIGLLKPAYRAANGYRYYTAQQLARMDIIKQLQLLDFSLEEIHDYLAAETMQQRQVFLQKQEQVILRQEMAIRRAKESLKLNAAQLTEFDTYGIGTLFLEETKAYPYVLQEKEPPIVLGAQHYGTQFGLLFDTADIPAKQDRYIVYYQSSQQEAMHIRPAGQYYSMYMWHQKDIHALLQKFLGDLPGKGGKTLYYAGCPLLSAEDAGEIIKLSVAAVQD